MKSSIQFDDEGNIVGLAIVFEDEDLSEEREEVLEGVHSVEEKVTARLNEKAFWASHPVLKDMHRYSLIQAVNPWAVLGATMARALVAIPSNFVLPPVVGGIGSLNHITALVGASGAGKTASVAASRDFIRIKNEERIVQGVGSGEGLLTQFLEWSSETKCNVRNERDGALIYIDEVSSLGAMSERAGSSLWSFIKQSWSGSGLETPNASAERIRVLEEHSYRICLLIGVQPRMSETLFRDEGGGFPQRALFLPADRPYAGLPSEEDVRWAKAKRDTPRLLPTPTAYSGRIEIKVCRKAWMDIYEFAHIDQNVSELDSHSLQVRESVAVALNLLINGKPEITEEAWSLSEVVMGVNRRTRDQCEEGAREERIRQGAKKGESSGAARAIAAETDYELRYRRCKDSIVRAFLSAEDNTMSATDLNRRISSVYKREEGGQASVYSRVMADLDAEGLIPAVEVDGRIHRKYVG